MQVGNTLSPSSTNNRRAAASSINSQHKHRSNSRARRNVSHGDSRMHSARDLRATVARRFMRMNEAHDRIRTELLASHSLDMK